MRRRKFLALLALPGLSWLPWLPRMRIAAQTPEPTPTPTPGPAPDIIPREDWGARPIDHQAVNEPGFASPKNPFGWYVYPGDLADIYRTVAIHHSETFLRDTGTMRQIQDYHLDHNHWADIGYHFGIDGQGKLYAGRDIHVRGASVGGFNTGTIGVVVIGNFIREYPAPAQLETLQSLVNWLTALYHLTYLATHDEFNPETICPGAHLRVTLNGIARNAGLRRGIGGYVPPTRTPIPDSPRP